MIEGLWRSKEHQPDPLSFSPRGNVLHCKIQSMPVTQWISLNVYLFCFSDSYGNVSPEMQPIRALAWAASGYVIWQNSTENTKYQLAQIKHVKQVKRTDEYLEFDYVILLHENVSQEIIPWQMTVLWHPQHGIEVTQNSCQAKHALD